MNNMKYGLELLMKCYLVYYCKRNSEIIDNLIKFVLEKRKYYQEIDYI